MSGVKGRRVASADALSGPFSPLCVCLLLQRPTQPQQGAVFRLKQPAADRLPRFKAAGQQGAAAKQPGLCLSRFQKDSRKHNYTKTTPDMQDIAYFCKPELKRRFNPDCCPRAAVTFPEVSL